MASTGREPNFIIGEMLVHRYGDVWVQCRNNTRRDRCDELVAGLSAMLQEARELLEDGGWRSRDEQKAVAAFLDRTSAPAGPSMPQSVCMADVLPRVDVPTLDSSVPKELRSVMVGLFAQAKAINALVDVVEAHRALPGHGGSGMPMVQRDEHDEVSGVELERRKRT